MAKIGELVLNIKANTAAFASDLRKVGDISFSSFKKIEKSCAVMAGVVASAFAAVKGATVAMAVDTANYGNELLKASQKTGIAVEQLSALRHAAEMSDVSFDSLVRGLGIFSKNLSGLQSTTSRSGKALQAIFGEDFQSKVRDASGQIKPLDQLLLAVSDRFRGTKDGGEKAAIALAAFGKTGMEYIPLLDSDMRSLMAEAKGLGLVFTEEDARAAATLHEQIKTLRGGVEGLEFTIGKVLMPTMIGWSIWLENMGPKLDEWHHRLVSLAYTVTGVGYAMTAAYGAIWNWKTAKAFFDIAEDEANAAANSEVKFEAAVSASAATLAARMKLLAGGGGGNFNIPIEAPKLHAAVDEFKDAVVPLLVELDKADREFGLSADAVKLYELKLAGADESELALAKRILASTDAKRAARAETEALAAATDDYQQSLISLAAQIETESLTGEQAFAGQIDKLREVTQAGLLSQDAFDWKRMQLEGEQLDSQLDKMTNSAREWGATLEGAFTQLVLHGADFRQTLANLVNLMGEMILKTYLFKSIAESFEGKSGLLGAVGSFFGGMVGKAGGGEVSGGAAYMVGERGPEVFIPDVAGAIIPSGGSASGIVNNYIDARGADASVERRILRALRLVHGSAVKTAQLQMRDRMLRSGA